jgi:hypothetical protein
MPVHLVHKGGGAHRIFLTLLRDSVQHMLKFHWMMDGMFLHYCTVLTASCDEGNWILSGQFAETVFAGTCRARLIHTRCTMQLWAALETHRILQGYMELYFIAHPEVSSGVVEHLIQTWVPMAMHEAMKADMITVKARAKALSILVEKLE